MTLTPPEVLGGLHQVGRFTCGVEELDDWLRTRAMRNQSAGATRTYVVSSETEVVGYYSIASSSIALNEATGRFRRNMPDPIPVILLARLAIATSHQGRRLGVVLLKDCAMRVIHLADQVGVRGLVVHAISEDARSFYEAFGFQPSGINRMTLMTTISDLRNNL